MRGQQQTPPSPPSRPGQDQDRRLVRLAFVGVARGPVRLETRKRNDSIECKHRMQAPTPDFAHNELRQGRPPPADSTLCALRRHLGRLPLAVRPTATVHAAAAAPRHPSVCLVSVIDECMRPVRTLQCTCSYGAPRRLKAVRRENVGWNRGIRCPRPWSTWPPVWHSLFGLRVRVRLNAEGGRCCKRNKFRLRRRQLSVRSGPPPVHHKVSRAR